MVISVIDYAPDIFFTSPAFPIAFRAAMAGLTLVQSDIVFASLDVLRSVIAHDCLDPAPVPPPKFPIYAAAIKPLVEKEGLELTGCLLSGLTGDFPEDAVSTVITIFRVLAALWSTQLLSWLPVVLSQLPSTSVPDQAKTVFLSDVTQCVEFRSWSGRQPCSMLTRHRSINARDYDKVKYAIITLNRASRKVRERRRNMGNLDR